MSSRAIAAGLAVLAASLGSGCGEAHDSTAIDLPDLRLQSAGMPPFLGLPVSVEDRADAPAWLSETGAFEDVQALRPARGLMPYGVASPLWSDGALKQRWMALPRGGRISFAEQGAFEFPPGTVLVKHFGMALDESRPEELERLETRFLVSAADGGFYGLVYRWNEDQSDAELLSGSLDETLQIVRADGSRRDQVYTYPGPGDCSACHSTANGFALGPRTAQLNSDHDYASGGGDEQVANQLATWNNLGFFDPPLDDRPPSDYPSLAPLDDESRSLQDRVRSYWASNCSACHRAGSPYAAWDARYELPLDEQNVVGVDPSRERGEGVLIVAPGHPELSLMYLRVQSSEPGMRMPPLLRSRSDEAFVDLLRRWILTLD